MDGDFNEAWWIKLVNTIAHIFQRGGYGLNPDVAKGRRDGYLLKVFWMDYHDDALLTVSAVSEVYLSRS